MSYNPRMKTKAAAAKKKTGTQKLETTSVTLRVSNVHLAEMEKLIKETGVARSSHIQLAISEYLERRRK
jgi:hypothetical protein